MASHRQDELDPLVRRLELPKTGGDGVKSRAGPWTDNSAVSTRPGSCRETREPAATSNNSSATSNVMSFVRPVNGFPLTRDATREPLGEQGQLTKKFERPSRRRGQKDAKKAQELSKETARRHRDAAVASADAKTRGRERRGGAKAKKLGKSHVE